MSALLYTAESPYVTRNRMAINATCGKIPLECCYVTQSAQFHVTLPTKIHQNKLFWRLS